MVGDISLEASGEVENKGIRRYLQDDTSAPTTAPTKSWGFNGTYSGGDSTTQFASIELRGDCDKAFIVTLDEEKLAMVWGVDFTICSGYMFRGNVTQEDDPYETYEIYGSIIDFDDNSIAILLRYLTFPYDLHESVSLIPRE